MPSLSEAAHAAMFAALEARGEIGPGEDPPNDLVVGTLQSIEDAPGGPRSGRQPDDADYIRAFTRYGAGVPVEHVWGDGEVDG